MARTALLSIDRLITNNNLVLALPLTVVVLFSFAFILVDPLPDKSFTKQSSFEKSLQQQSIHVTGPQATPLNPAAMQPASDANAQDTNVDSSQAGQALSTTGSSTTPPTAPAPESKSITNLQSNVKNVTPGLLDSVTKVVPAPVIKSTLHDL